MLISNVFFRYNQNNETVLKAINLKINKGEKIALVGHSGAGKTTLLNLIPRFFDVNKGKIFLGGIDIKDLSFKFLRDHFSIVSQDITLFDDTILENVRYGKRNTKMNEIIDACKRANCQEFIKKLPKNIMRLLVKKVSNYPVDKNKG